MRKIRLLAAGTLALILASLGAIGTSSDRAVAQQPVTPRLTVTQEGNLATFVILVRNENPGRIGTSEGQAGQIRNLEVKGLVPEGTNLVQC